MMYSEMQRRGHKKNLLEEGFQRMRWFVGEPGFHK